MYGVVCTKPISFNSLSARLSGNSQLQPAAMPTGDSSVNISGEHDMKTVLLQLRSVCCSEQLCGGLTVVEYLSATTGLNVSQVL